MGSVIGVTPAGVDASAVITIYENAMTCSWSVEAFPDAGDVRYVVPNASNTSGYATIARKDGTRTIAMVMVEHTAPGDPVFLRYTSDGGDTWNDTATFDPDYSSSGRRHLIYDNVNDIWVYWNHKEAIAYTMQGDLAGASWGAQDLNTLANVEPYDYNLFFHDGLYLLVPEDNVTDGPPFLYYANTDIISGSWLPVTVPDDTTEWYNRGCAHDGTRWYLLQGDGTDMQLWVSTTGYTFTVAVADVEALFGGLLTDVFPDIGADDGRVVIIAGDIGAGTYSIYSDDGGLTWSSPVQLGTDTTSRIKIGPIAKLGDYWVAGEEGGVNTFGSFNTEAIWTSYDLTEWSKCITPLSPYSIEYDSTERRFIAGGPNSLGSVDAEYLFKEGY